MCCCKPKQYIVDFSLESPSINDELLNINDEPPSINREPPSMADEPPSINDESPSINDESPSMADEPPLIDNEAQSINDESLNITPLPSPLTPLPPTPLTPHPSLVLYQISHTTNYSYSQPVSLLPHVVRLRPRSDGSQTVRSFSLMVTPTPSQEATVTDLDGNTLDNLWFKPDQTDTLTVQVSSQVETHRTNPFDYVPEAWVARLPIDYPSSLLLQLQPYLSGQQVLYATSVDPIALQLAQEIVQAVGSNTISFLGELNQRIYKGCQYMIRETGDPLSAGVTWTTRSGTCRDFAVLFVEVCRAIGLAARFVSGYQEGDPNSNERHLHAWAEVYLPGGGWRGYDPTQGLAVADRHIALVASPLSSYAAPISGAFKQANGAQSTMTYQLTIQGLA